MYFYKKTGNMITRISIEEFLTLSKDIPVFDVRTPAEYEKGHFPLANSLPLFSNEDRHHIGLTYKEKGKYEATLKGLELVSPRLKELVTEVDKNHFPKQVLLYCWRGGMRSGSVGWLLEFTGHRVFTLDGGYKSWRKYVYQQLGKLPPLLVLGGYTGSSKSEILTELSSQNTAVILLEKLANHKGSAFGFIGEGFQPTQEHFDNLLAWELSQVSSENYLFLEDESNYIGHVQIPSFLWKSIRQSRVIFLEIPLTLRVEHVVKQYGNIEPKLLAKGILKIREKLGNVDTDHALNLLQENKLIELAEFLLKRYYDPAYEYGVSKRPKENIIRIKSNTLDVKINAALVQEEIEKIIHSNKAV